MTYNVRNIVIALVLAAVAAGAVIMYTGNVQKKANDSQATIQVLKATSDIPAGVLASDALANGQLRLEPVVKRDEIAGAVEDPKSIDGSLVSGQPIYAGQQVTPAMFAPSNTTATDARIKQTTRAIQVSLDKNAMLSETLVPGDHIDLVGTFTVHPTNGGPDFDISRIIVRDVEVLQAPDSGASGGGQKLGGGTSSGQSVILAVPDSVIPKITLAMHAGPDALWFILRPQSGATDTHPDPVATVTSEVFDGLNATQINNLLGVKGAGK
jgi:Flp pilus assembly protein CpaB